MTEVYININMLCVVVYMRNRELERQLFTPDKCPFDGPCLVYESRIYLEFVASDSIHQLSNTVINRIDKRSALL